MCDGNDRFIASFVAQMFVMTLAKSRYSEADVSWFALPVKQHVHKHTSKRPA